MALETKNNNDLIQNFVDLSTELYNYTCSNNMIGNPNYDAKLSTKLGNKLDKIVKMIINSQDKMSEFINLLDNKNLLTSYLAAEYLYPIYPEKCLNIMKAFHNKLEDKIDKYLDILSTRGKGPFVIMQLLPFFPDDVLCILAGVTNMNFWFYLMTMLVIRPIVIAVYCFLGSGSIIPFSGWGIPVWILIFMIFITLGILTYKYQDKIDEWFLKHKTIKK